MKMYQLLLATCLAAATSHAWAQCPPGQNELRLEIQPDEYWYEVSWAVTNQTGSTVFFSGTCTSENFATYQYCVPDDVCTVFRISDSYGDGMVPDGFYRLYFNNELIYENIGGNYGTGENVYVGCPQGTHCGNPFDLATGTFVTPTADETWYSFVPADTGTYQLSTCFPENTCPTKIWVYDQCQGITITNNQTGAIFYADGGCDDGALATLNLAGGKEYFVRLRYATVGCSTAPIHFALTYVGPVVGCTDPLACNFNPLATVSADCIYPGDPACPDGPDLVVLEDILRFTMESDAIANPDICAVEEGCLRGLGTRYIIRFTTHIKNIGNQDYYIGQTPSSPSSPSDQFVWDPCHNHWHYRGYAEYVIFDAAGNLVPIGSKNGFCVLDLECSDGGFGNYSCDNMGISAGCGDIYDSYLPCQWIDITDLPAGAYTMVVRVNWDKSPDKVGRVEKDYNNNWAQACFILEYDNDSVPEITFNDDCPQYTDCLGVPFGDAQADCNGDCNGSALHGDINQDTLRNADDVQAYLAAALSDGANASQCTDLFSDGKIDVFDAALLQECNLYANDPQHWGQSFPCQFPTGYENTKDIVYLLPGALDTVAKTFDIQIVNPYNKVLGYEFSVSGLQVSSVENLSADFDAAIQFDTTGEIIALSATESPVKKNILPTNFLRVHYSALTASQVCVSAITAIVNDKYERSSALLADPNCVSTGTSTTGEPGKTSFAVFVQPNPFHESTTIFFENQDAEPVTVTLTDMTGRVVRSFNGVRAESVTFERGNLPDGTYFFTVSGSKGSVSGKIVAQ
jgi:hypothetical protein